MRLPRALLRLAYYSQNVARDCAPQIIFRRRLESLVGDPDVDHPPDLLDRVNYYNKLREPARLPPGTATVGSLPMRRSRYYYDLKEYARYFPRDYRLRHVFGDVVTVPTHPAIVKSRPIVESNANSVLLKLNKFRHFQFFDDRIDFAAKKSMAVWRGGGGNPMRRALLRKYGDHPLCDFVRTDAPGAPRQKKGFLSLTEQMKYRYIVSIEGNDVATNLKWIMASQSLCLMPKPMYETWFMEGRLQAGVHYVQLRSDFEDLEERIMHYERYQDEAREIVLNANAHAAQFKDSKREQIISLLVLRKYFAMTRPELAAQIAIPSKLDSAS